MKELSINAVVVTHNRKALLNECLQSLLSQSYPLNKIFVIDNCSTDDTLEYLKTNYSGIKNIEVYAISKNTGGAGGFYAGTVLSREGADWVWLMDDDTIPSSTALAELINALDFLPKDTSFLASTVYGPEDEPMNLPVISSRTASNGYQDWYRYLERGCVEISSATFVSVLVNADAIESVGAPHPYFFIWGDDTEYTLRLSKYFGPGFFVGTSKVLHKRIGAKVLSLANEDDKNRLKLFHYLVRNQLVYTRFYKGRFATFKLKISFVLLRLKILFGKYKFKIKKIGIVTKGVWAYNFGKYNKKAFLNRFGNLKDSFLQDIISRFF